MPDVAAEPILLIEDRGPVRLLTLNRPDALNALNAELTEAISVQIRAAGADDTVSVVIWESAANGLFGTSLTELSPRVRKSSRAKEASRARHHWWTSSCSNRQR